MAVIVTGSSGFLGQRLCQLWNDEEEIIKIDIVGNPDIRLDLCNYVELYDALQSKYPQLIIHLAAYSHVINNQQKQSPLEILGYNVLSTFNVLQVASLIGCPIILAGSAQEYGSWPEDAGPPNESNCANPIEPYALSKYIGSLFVEDRLQEACILRFSNLYGPGQRGKFIPMLIEAALAGKQLTLYDKGRQSRQFLYIDDAVEAIRLAADSQYPSRAYNITSMEEISIRDVAITVYNALQDECLKRGRNLPLLDLKLEDGGGGAARICMDCTHAIYNLKWTPQTSFEDGIRKTVIAELNRK